ncbi:hypothetical protein GUJ93_ZPchr0013g34059 [Zizania palustris]|uniref:Uncharacterized protein n=1 Tax=Zizania palustris TaxID=103762 RepID=A0A8J5X237_ZIZPA|nr:hypothetical protein GUJ93_ZPchr0013g34059 [Zizania palustris]
MPEARRCLIDSMDSRETSRVEASDCQGGDTRGSAGEPKGRVAYLEAVQVEGTRGSEGEVASGAGGEHPCLRPPKFLRGRLSCSCVSLVVPRRHASGRLRDIGGEGEGGEKSGSKGRERRHKKTGGEHRWRGSTCW